MTLTVLRSPVLALVSVITHSGIQTKEGVEWIYWPGKQSSDGSFLLFRHSDNNLSTKCKTFLEICLFVVKTRKNLWLNIIDSSWLTLLNTRWKNTYPSPLTQFSHLHSRTLSRPYSACKKSNFLSWRKDAALILNTVYLCVYGVNVDVRY